MNINERKIAPSALDMLMAYNWPGNVRELENVIERALVIGGGNEIMEKDLPFSPQAPSPDFFPQSLKMMEKIHIERLLNENDWNISRSARDLGIDRQTLYNKMEKYKINKRG